MAPSSGRRPPLRADRRYGAKSASSGRKAALTKKTPKPKRAAKKRSARPTPRGGPIRWLLRLPLFVVGLIWSLTWRTSVVVALLIGGAVAYFAAEMPSIDALVDGRTRGSVTILDRDGAVFAWRGEQFDAITDPSQVSPHLVHAIIATEDRRFYRHLGVSPRGIASAVRINLSEGRGPLSGHGGSTLTQQTAKLLCLGVPYDPTVWESEAAYEADCRRTTMWRKIKEAIYAMGMEVRYSKDEILTIYINRAYLGASARGFEAAADRYFGTHAATLTPAQSAMLAGLLVAPSRYAPTNNLERSQRRAATVVRLMYEQGYLSVAQRDTAWAEPAVLSEAAQARAGGYFADWVMDAGPSFLTRDTTEDVVIRSTLDQNMQLHAEEALAQVFSEKVSAESQAQAAIVVMSADGAVRAMVGGRNAKVSGAFNRATQAKRQTGSSFKPFVYATAMELGYTPNSTVLDDEYCVYVAGSGEYCPKNYTRRFEGWVTLTEALAKSLNIPAVRISEALGRDLVRKVATDFGIDNALATGPSLALGVSESTLLEMTGAFAGILNGGRSVEPYGLIELRLQGDDTPLAAQTGGFGERVISEGAARSLVYMMSQVIDAGTGGRAKLEDRPAAGKTGTTQAARDAWFIGFSADYVVGVWMGYDDNTPLKGVTGGGLPAEIWREVMLRIHEDLPVRALPMEVPAPLQAQEPQAQPQQPRNQAGRTPVDREANSVLEDVLNNLFGRNN